MSNNIFINEKVTTKEMYTFIADLEISAEDTFLGLLIKMDDIYLHTYEKYIHRLDRLYDKVKSGNLNRAKIVSGIIKAVTSTILKWSANEKLASLLELYLSRFFEKHEFLLGQKLTKEDWTFIEDYPLTDDNAPHHIIVKVYNNAYYFPYYDEEDDDIYKEIIPASIVFGK